MNDVFYSPFFKTKRGEAKALAHLDDEVKSLVRPFFDVLALESGVTAAPDVEKHLLKQTRMIALAWANQGPCYVDLFDVNPAARAINGVHPLALVMSNLHAAKVTPIPVFGLERDVPYQLALRAEIANLPPPAIAVRLEAEDLVLPDGLAERISRIGDVIGARGIPLHVVMDFRSFHWRRGNIEDVVADALTAIRQLKPAKIIFAGSSMVASMGSFKKNTINRIPREEYLAWKNIVDAGNADVAFGDYGVVHPDYVDLDPRFIKPSAKIRYSTPTGWVVVKGTSWRDDTSQHHRLAAALIKAPEFLGIDCWGVRYIKSSADGRPSYGTLETWVTVDQNTHITVTAFEIMVALGRAYVRQ
ncbi:Beta protein [Variovorax sp. OK605]|uniref:beta family protein n=1 Tax=Variovorax sp. OK605 TaxID=1855317 RepID=UPI0008EF7E16|nr:beta family protein [Variovorax sp. OK605]SFP46588.1 Beta protein [Variovorax sp. OK605]